MKLNPQPGIFGVRLLSTVLLGLSLQNVATAGDLPDWAKAVPVLKPVSGYGTFVCVPAPDERYYAKSKSDPAIPEAVRRRVTCPKGTTLMSTVPALRTGAEVFGAATGITFVCIPAIDPEELKPKFGNSRFKQPTDLTPETYAKLPKDCPDASQAVVFYKPYDPSKVSPPGTLRHLPVRQKKNSSCSP